MNAIVTNRVIDQYVRYELHEKSSNPKLGWRRVGSAREFVDEADAIDQLKKQAAAKRKTERDLRWIVDLGPTGKMRIVRCNVEVLEITV
jgi:hypothetical protein